MPLKIVFCDLSMGSQKNLIVLVGPTGVGKTNMAMLLAKEFHTEIISADSRQLYKELNAGTAKPTKEELNLVPHHFIDYLSIADDYDAGLYGKEALEIINHLFKKYDYVILCGGSGLYVKSVCEGFDELPDVKKTDRTWIRANYEQNGLSWLRQELEKNDPDYLQVVDENNPQRMMRALEIIKSTGKSLRDSRTTKKNIHNFHILKIGLEIDRKELYQKLDARMDHMIGNGLFEEADQLFSRRDLNALQTVGYREVFGFMDGAYSKDDAIRLLKRNTRRYAKRQMTWFGKDKEIKWFHPSDFSGIMNHLEKFSIESSS